MRPRLQKLVSGDAPLSAKVGGGGGGGGGGAAPAAVENKKQPKLNFASGDSIATARRLAETRKFVVAPWNQDVKPKPILAVSDDYGDLVKQIAASAFLQFGRSEKLRMSFRRNASSKESIDEALQTAAMFKEGPALVLHTFCDQELDAYMRAEAAKLGVPCIDATGGLVEAMRRRFSPTTADPDPDATSDAWCDLLDDREPTVFAVSDSTGELARTATKAALEQVGAAAKVKTMTVCPEVTSLEEVLLIAQRAFATGGVVTFSFASPGLSRFMRMQCERLKVTYADLLQPVLITMEQYLEYPFVGVPGGLDLNSVDSTAVSWKVEEV